MYRDTKNGDAQPMQQPQQQQQEVNVVEAREKYRGVLLDQHKRAQARLAAAEAALKAAQTEAATAKAAAEQAQTEINAFNTSFPPPAQKGKGGRPAASTAAAAPAPAPASTKASGKAAGKNGQSPKASKGAGKVGRIVINAPVKAPAGGNLTVPDRVAAVMGDRIMDAGELIDALGQAGETFKSTNLRSYISTTLNSADMNVPGPNGALKFPDGKLVKVHRFTAVQRGQYRVTTVEDVQNELKKLLGASEVVISGTPADAVFADQNMDVRAAISTQH